MFKIGEFSKLAQVPVPTLRYYDQMGLLKPLEVDRFTGYRYYSASQLPLLHRILVLRGLGFSLEQISAALTEDMTTEQMRGMLSLRHAQINQQLEEAQNQLHEVEARLQQIEHEREINTYDVMLKSVEPLLVALVRTILPDHSVVGSLFKEVYDGIGPHVAEALGPHPGQAGQTLVLWYDTEFKDRDVDGAAAFMLRCRVPDNGRMKVEELPACTVAATVHHGSYNTINEAHEAVLTWIEAHDYRIVGPDREIYLYNSAPLSRDNPTYVTEIQYPVEKIISARIYDILPTLQRRLTMNTTEPKIENRPEQPTVGIRTQIPHHELPNIIPQLLDETEAWLHEQGAAQTGIPFIRYHVINMEGDMDIEVGWPVAAGLTSSGRVKADVIPAGRYASLIYTDVAKGIEGNSVLIGWAKEQGMEWDAWNVPAGHAFASRVEYFLDGPDDDPDPANWRTEVAIKLAD